MTEKVLRERQLFAPLKAHFKTLGYTIYCEVPCFGRAIDFVCVKGDEQIAVEMKMGLTRDVIRQAGYNQMVYDKSYAAIPTKPTKKNLDHCIQRGIGVLHVGETISLLLESNINEKPYLEARKSFVGWEEGEESGNPMLKGDGPTYEVLKEVKAYVRKHPEASWREIAANIKHHYSNHTSLAGCMSQWRGFSLSKFKQTLK